MEANIIFLKSFIGPVLVQSETKKKSVYVANRLITKDL